MRVSCKFIQMEPKQIALITEPGRELGAGVGRYSRSLVQSLLRQPASFRFLLVQDRQGFEPLGPKAALRCFPRFYRGPGSTYLWYFSLSLRLRGVDLVHNLSQIPTFFPFVSGMVVTVHDLSPLSLPFTHRPLKKTLYGSLLPSLLRRAQAVIAVSETTRRELIRFCPEAASKVRTIPLGVDPFFRPLLGEGEKERVRKAYRLEVPFLLTVGQIERRKNLVRWLRAFAQIRRHGSPYRLVLVGRPSFRAREVYRAIDRLGLKGVVRVLGPVPEEDLVPLYNLATLLVFPSLYEGFGLPALEAMACGLPVCASREGALPEVLGEAGRFFDPYRVEDMAEVVWGLLEDQALCRDLAEKGLKRAKVFSWKRCAEATLRVYEEVLEA